MKTTEVTGPGPWLCGVKWTVANTFTGRTLAALDLELGVKAQGLTLNLVGLGGKHWHQSLRLLMWAQILRAGPSLMFMVDMRCSSFSSSRACPSISCDRNWEASSSQPTRTKRNLEGEENKNCLKVKGRKVPNLVARKWTVTPPPRSTGRGWEGGSWTQSSL